MSKKYYLVKIGRNKYNIQQYAYSYIDCDDYDISSVPCVMGKIRAQQLYKKVLKDYNNKKDNHFSKRNDLKINIELIEYNS